MDQIYREYSEKYKHILHYAGIMKKENVLFENQEIIVLKDVKDYQDFDVVNRKVDFEYVNKIMNSERKKVDDFITTVIASYKQTR